MTTTTRVTDLHVDIWGEGTPVVLVHGSLATGADEWSAQRPLADNGARLVVFDRRGYGSNPNLSGEDYLADADDIITLMGDGAHLVGHSYGGLGAMIAAARRPDLTLSLTLLEPAAGSLALDDPDWQGLVAEVRALWDRHLSDHDWVVAFLEAVGSDPGSLPDELIDAAVELLPTFRNGRPFHTAQLPIDELAAAAFPKLVVSGGHGPGFEAMCDDLARKIGAARTVLPGAGHEIQFVGQPLNDKLTELWSGQPVSSANDGRTGRA
jgi:pimeloyl-ACP methyl ester carboxylesterase